MPKFCLLTNQIYYSGRENEGEGVENGVVEKFGER